MPSRIGLTAATLLATSLLLVDVASAQSKEDYQRAAEQQLAQGNLVRARELASSCLDMAAGDRKCTTLHDQANRALAKAWSAELARANENDLPKRQQALQQLQMFEPRPKTQALLEKVFAERNAIEAEAKAFVEALHQGGATNFPSALMPYVPYMLPVARARAEAWARSNARPAALSVAKIQSKEDYQRAAEQELKQGNLLRARELASSCLSVATGDRTCTSLHDEANLALTKAWAAELARANENDLPKRHHPPTAADIRAAAGDGGLNKRGVLQAECDRGPSPGFRRGAAAG